MDKKPEYKAFASKMKDDLYRSLRLISVAEDKSVQMLIEEAVTEYLVKRELKTEFSDDGVVTMLSIKRSDPNSKESDSDAPIIRMQFGDPANKKDKSGK